MSQYIDIGHLFLLSGSFGGPMGKHSYCLLKNQIAAFPPTLIIYLFVDYLLNTNHILATFLGTGNQKKSLALMVLILK